jgi:hypothetical protein
MARHLSVEDMLGIIRDKEAELRELKRAANTFLKAMGEEPAFTLEEWTGREGARTVKPDQFFGRPLATAVREFLDFKGQAASVEEIVDALEAGGFDFKTNPENRHRNVAISLAKNTPVFVKLPNGTFGLRNMYPDLKKERIPRGGAAAPTEGSGESAESE